MMEYILRTNALTKQYKDKKAVDQVSLNIHKGDVYGFIGKNGAGKTTLMKMVSGLAEPKSGSIELFGSKNLTEGRKKCGTIIEQPALYPNMTVRENLKYYCLILNIKDPSYIDNLLNTVGLEEAKNKKSKNLSLGMKQRLSIAIALISNPELLILDEPMNGLDPTGIKEIRELFLRLNKERNITILISSHILGELYKIANRYGVIDNGVMIDEFTKEELDKRCEKYLTVKVEDTNKASLILEDELHIKNYKIINKNTIYVYEGLERSWEMNKILVSKNVEVQSVTLESVDLEAYFMELMGGKKNA